MLKVSAASLFVWSLWVSVFLSPIAGKECETSPFTRKPCSYSQIIADRASCEQLGCCFTDIGPIRGRCYKAGRNMFGGSSFTPTQSPSINSMQGLLTVGGSKGFPGSLLRLQCNTRVKCNVNHKRYQPRMDCWRKGCCWITGECYSTTYKILRLRNKCPPGFENPPQCTKAVGSTDSTNSADSGDSADSNDSAGSGDSADSTNSDGD